MKVTTTIGERIADARIKKGLTAKQLAGKADVGLSTIKNLESGNKDESGKERSIMVRDLLKIATVLDTSVYYLITENDDENHVVCEELGLSNQTVIELRSICSMSKMNRPQQGYYQDKLRVIDCLVKDQPLLDTIAGYLFHDFSEFHVINETGLYTATLTKNGTFTEEDNAALFKLRIMDRLSALRESVKGGSTK